jgi:hypothetical protein
MADVRVGVVGTVTIPTNNRKTMHYMAVDIMAQSTGLTIL